MADGLGSGAVVSVGVEMNGGKSLQEQPHQARHALRFNLRLQLTTSSADGEPDTGKWN